jgi:small-conductance mechanosensitive channel
MSRAWAILQPALAPIVAVLCAWLVAAALTFIVGRAARRPRHSLVPLSLQRRCRYPVRAALLVTALLIALPETQLSAPAYAVVRHVLTLALIGAASWLVIALTGVFEDIIVARINVDVEDNRRARRTRTQIMVLRRVLAALIVFLAIATGLMTFATVRSLGASFLASAGVLSVVAGLAAQTTLANLFAGLQIALTDPIRIDDVVVVNGEWGHIEAITLTYVVVRSWDNRRLILPVSWFTTNVFQNWTRHESRVLGSVLLHTDYTVPVAEVRAELYRLVRQSPLWDGRDWALQVVDATPTTMVLRGLMSSADAPSNWDLRCDVREKLLTFLQQRHPESLPKLRTQVGGPRSADARELDKGHR